MSEAPTKGQLLKSILPVVLMLGLRNVPFQSEEQQLLVARGVFLFRIVLTALIAAWIGVKIGRMSQTEATTVIKAHEKNTGMGQTEMVPEKTLAIYDREALIDFLKQAAFQIAFIAFLHIKFEMVQPLILTSVVGIVALSDSPIFQVYVLNKTLPRPFPSKPVSGLMGLFGGATEATPAAEPATKKNQ